MTTTPGTVSLSRGAVRLSLVAATLTLCLGALAREPSPPPPPPPPPSAGSGATTPPKAASVVPDEEGKKTKVTKVRGQALAVSMQSYLHAFLALSEKIAAVPVVVWDRTESSLRITLVGDRESTVEARSAVRLFRQEALVRTLEILEYAYETQLDTEDYYIEYRSKKDMKLQVRYVDGKFETP